MEDIKKYIESGILEAYILGSVSSKEADKVEQLASSNDEVRRALDEISEALEIYALANPVMPDPMVKPMVMAAVDYTERRKNGEPQSFPPELHAASIIIEYAEWLGRTDLQAPDTIEDIHARIIGYTPQMMTAIVWIKEMAPQEVHDDEFEKFLVLEGTCDVIVEDDVYHLVPGNLFNIPLHKNHVVKVTSAFPCKVILQRVAA